MSDLLTAAEVAEILRVSRPAVYQWATAGLLPCVRIGGRVRFRADTIQAILDRGRIDPVLGPVRELAEV